MLVYFTLTEGIVNEINLKNNQLNMKQWKDILIIEFNMVWRLSLEFQKLIDIILEINESNTQIAIEVIETNVISTFQYVMQCFLVLHCISLGNCHVTAPLLG